MKKALLIASVSLLMCTAFTQVYSQDASIQANRPMMGMQMMQMNINQNDLYSNLSPQDKALFDSLNPQQKAFVLKMVNIAPHLKMIIMHKKMMESHMPQGEGAAQPAK